MIAGGAGDVHGDSQVGLVDRYKQPLCILVLVFLLQGPRLPSQGLEPGYEDIRAGVLEPGYEGIRAGVRGY